MKSLKVLKFIAAVSAMLFAAIPSLSYAAEAQASVKTAEANVLSETSETADDGFLAPSKPTYAEIRAKYSELSFDVTKYEDGTGYSKTSPYAKGSMDLLR